MKKIICLLLAACLLLGLGACSKTPEPPADTGAKTDTAAATQAPGTEALGTEAPGTEAPATEPATEEPVVTTTEAPAPAVPAEAPELAQLPAKWSLKELGTVDNSDRDIYFSHETVFRYTRDGDDVILTAVDLKGEAISQEKYANVRALLPGVLAVSTVSEDINSTGLILEETGEQILPCEAAIIRTISEEYDSDLDSQRYLYVIYGTEVTENKDEAFFYATSAMISITPGEDDVLYKGYARVFDLVEKRFVPELTVTNSSMIAVKTGGSLISYTDENNVTTILNSDGVAVRENAEYPYLGCDIALVDGNTVIGADGSTLFESENYLTLLDGSGKYVVENIYNADEVRVFDARGAELFAVSGEYSVYSEGGGLFCGRKDNKDACLLDAQGKVVVAVEDAYTPEYKGCGVWEISYSENEKNSTYYLADGRSVTGSEKYAHDLVLETKNETSGVCTLSFWNDPEKTVDVEASYIDRLANGLVVANGKPCSLIDCFSGETLLTAESIELVEGKYIFAKDGSSYKVFELTLE